MPLLKNKTASLMTLTVMAFCLLAAFKVNASAPFSDTFDGYSDGALNGQGTWAASGSNVQTTTAKSGKAADCSGVSCYGYKSGTETESGTWYFWFKADLPDGTNYRSVIFFRNGVGGQFQIRVYADGADLKVCDGTTVTVCLTGLVTADWHYLAVDWNSTQYRMAVDGGAWSAYSDRAATDGGIHGMQFQNNNPVTGAWYIDEISDTYAPPAFNAVTVTDPTNGARNAPLYNWQVNLNAATTSVGYFIDVVSGESETDVTNATATTTNVTHSTTLVTPTSASTTVAIPNRQATELDHEYYFKALLYDTVTGTIPDFLLGGSLPVQFRGENLLATSTVGMFWPTDYVQIGNATTSSDFYANHVPAFFATTTPSVVYTSMTGLFNVIFTPLLELLQNFANFFNITEATANGTSAGAALALIFAYAQMLNIIFGIPIVTIFVSGFLIEIALIVWKQSHRAIKTVK